LLVITAGKQTGLLSSIKTMVEALESSDEEEAGEQEEVSTRYMHPFRRVIDPSSQAICSCL